MSSVEILGFAAGPYKTNTYIVANEKRAIIVDPGMHAAARVLELGKEHGLTFEAIVLTHGHLDHTREAGDLARQLSLPVYIHPADAFMLVDGAGVSPQSQVLFDAEHMLPIADLRELADGETLDVAGLSLALHHAPGHSPGSTILVGEGFALTGDVLFQGSIGRTDLEHSDNQAMQRSLRGPVWDLDDSLAILPGHGPTSTMRRERATNPFLAMLREVL
ncbi:MBL fold metallo-hydrolase [Corynebacterium sp.]|uniref:MBL fold metallo-hydrolase n=1 Tax=Corynebacterium sp. TaxID=1720 RepID=UPI0026DD8226|nr:MBL fold metallo-hydrolase [Corynebacterium sp.]MDO5031760.1 MBL fold metallo-hydrolase [Corynebacterium sp.]